MNNTGSQDQYGQTNKWIWTTSMDDKKLRSLWLIPFLFWWMQTSIGPQTVGTSTPSPVKWGLQFASASALHPMEEEEKQKENKERITMLDIKS